MFDGLVRADSEAVVTSNGARLGISGGVISGGLNGIRLLSGFPLRSTVVTIAGGSVTGTAGAGITTDTPLTLSVGSAATVSGRIGIESTGAPVNARIGGTVTGTGGTAIQFGAGNDSLTLEPTATINGNVLAGAGIDTFRLGGPGEGTFDVGQIGPSAKFQGFERFEVASGPRWRLTGSGAQDWVINGTLTGDTNSLQGNLVNNGFLTFDQAFDGTYSRNISGSGILLKDGSGTVTFSGVNDFSGAPLVNGGSLVVNGSLANSRVHVFSLLEGSGTVRDISLNESGVNPFTGQAFSGGTVSPGHNSIGTLTARESITFVNGSTYWVDVNAAGQSDQLRTRIADLRGGTVRVFAAPGSYGSSATFRIFSASSGFAWPFQQQQPPQPTTFAGVTVNLPFLDPTLSYSANDVFLTLTRNPTFLTRNAFTANQLGVARALDAAPTDYIPFLVAAGETPAGMRQAFDLLSGEVHASAVTTAVEESRHVRDAVFDRLRSANSALNGPAQTVPAAFAADAPQRASTVPMPAQCSISACSASGARVSAPGAAPTGL
jgi:autotransporter-associated beta strand protein